MKNKLCFGLAIIALLNVLGTAMAVSFNAKTVGSAGEAQITGNFKLDDSTDLSISANLDSGSLSKEMNAKGSGFNSLDESVSTKDKKVQNTVISSGSMITSSSSFGSNNGIVVNHNTNLAGDLGFIGTKADSSINQMAVASGFEETGTLNEQTRSCSDNAAYVGGTVSSGGGVDLLNDEISKAVYAGGMQMEVEGLTMSGNDQIGKFSLVAANQAKAVGQTKPTGTSIGPKSLASTNNPTTPGEIMTDSAFMGSSSSYSLLGYKIDTNNPVQLYLKADQNLKNEGLDSTATAKSIATAAETWDRSTSKELLKDNVIVSTNVQADRGDGYSVQAFIPISGSAIAYTRTWTYTSTGLVADSDLCYNSGMITQSDGSKSNLIWTNDWTNNWVSSQKNSKGKYPASYIMDVQSIALHELGHTAGLGDLYLSGSTDWFQVMNSYNGPQRYLGSGDIAGLQQKYGL